MSAFKKKGRTIYDVKIPTRDGEWVMRTTSTRDTVTAKRMQAMVDAIAPKGKRRWALVDALVDYRITVPEMYDVYLEVGRDLDLLEARLADVNIEPMVAEWAKNPGGKVKPGSDSAAHYLHHVRGFIPKGEPFHLSQFTTAAIQQHIEELDAAPATKRKAGAAISSFGRWLFRRNVLKTKPMRDVELPSAGAPRVSFLETADAIRLAEAQPSPYREYSALLAGSGIEVSAALKLRRRDVDMTKKEIHAAGTKAYTRDRIVRVADWAWPYVERIAKGLTPDARLFAGIPDRWVAADKHNEAINGKPAVAGRAEVKGLVAQFPIYGGYTMRDHRHTWAVRAVRSGMPIEMVARQLGHTNGILALKVYGRFVPHSAERDRWEQAASKHDVERKEEAK